MQGSICGYVVQQETGAPIAGLRITVHGSHPIDEEVNTDIEEVASSTAVTDHFGRFGLDLDEGPWLVRAQDSTGHELGEARVHVFGNSLSEVTIEATFALRSGTWKRQTYKRKRTLAGMVRGRVVRADNGDPIPHASITIVRGAKAAPDISPLTDSEGRFIFEGLGAGDWLLRAHGPGGQTGEATVSVASGGTAEITIAVETTSEDAPEY